MRNPFRRKPRWQRAAGQVASTKGARRGALAATGVVGLSAASAVVTALRERNRT